MIKEYEKLNDEDKIKLIKIMEIIGEGKGTSSRDLLLIGELEFVSRVDIKKYFYTNKYGGCEFYYLTNNAGRMLEYLRDLSKDTSENVRKRVFKALI